MKEKNPYAVLGLPAGASAGDVTMAYRRLARRLHPDICDDPRAAEQFSAATRAYEQLRATTRKPATPTTIPVRRRDQVRRPPLVAGPVRVTRLSQDQGEGRHG